MYSLDAIAIYHDQSSRRSGSDFESDVYNALSKEFKIEKHIGDDMDKNEGTDFTHGELRIDTTLDFVNKDHMPFVCDTGITATSCHNFKMGIRIGNSHKGFHEFPEPVVVIGLDMDTREYRKWQDVIEESLVKHAKQIMFAANDVYLDYTTTDKEEREELFEQPLKTNRAFHEPDKLSERYKELNELQYSVKTKNKGDDQYD